MLSYVITLNLIRLSLKHRYNHVIVFKTLNTQRLLQLLLTLNIILGWTLITRGDKSFFKVYLNTKFDKKIVTILKPSKQLSLQLKDICSLNNNFKSGSIVLTTNHGLLTLSEAVTNKCGGTLLFCLL